MKKYEMIPEGTVYRIKALRDFGDVKQGDLGGLIEKEANLSQKNSCWVHKSARVYDSAVVSGSARISGWAQVYASAHVYGSAIVSGLARVCGSAVVCGSAQVYDSACVYGSAVVCGSAHVSGSAHVHELAHVYGSAHVRADSVCTNDTINLIIAPHLVTITDNNVHIGCRTFKKEQVLNVSYEEVADDISKQEYMRYKAILRVILNPEEVA